MRKDGEHMRETVAEPVYRTADSESSSSILLTGHGAVSKALWCHWTAANSPPSCSEQESHEAIKKPLAHGEPIAGMRQSSTSIRRAGLFLRRSHSSSQPFPRAKALHASPRLSPRLGLGQLKSHSMLITYCSFPWLKTRTWVRTSCISCLDSLRLKRCIAVLGRPSWIVSSSSASDLILVDSEVKSVAAGVSKGPIGPVHFPSLP